jgi:hypothetical protein
MQLIVNMHFAPGVVQPCAACPVSDVFAIIGADLFDF